MPPLPLAPIALLVLLLTIAGLMGVFYYGRRQQPGRRRFACAHCATPTAHNERTLEAWRNGKAKFFCDRCHGEWLHNHSAPPLAYQAESGRSGCLGTLAVLVLLPALSVGLGIWLI